MITFTASKSVTTTASQSAETKPSAEQLLLRQPKSLVRDEPPPVATTSVSAKLSSTTATPTSTRSQETVRDHHQNIAHQSKFEPKVTKPPMRKEVTQSTTTTQSASISKATEGKEL